jgi:probable HAF family extracellular repeat protein
MNTQTKVSFAVVVFLTCSLVRVNAELSFTVIDLGTLGGNSSTASSVAGQGSNATGMVVGSSTMSDNSEHAFLYSNGQMFDLNTLCDLSQSDFKVLTVARTISDSFHIIGDGITKNGDKHAFLLIPLSVAGGQWNNQCCQWVWIQDGGGWWWESNCGCYKWHGPPGRHPPCPPRPPPPPCPPPCNPPPRSTPTPTPPRQTPTPTPPTRQTPTPTPPNWTPTPTPPNWTPTPTYPPQTPTPTLPPPVRMTPTPTPNQPVGVPVGVLPTPTPTAPPLGLGPGIRRTIPTPTPIPSRKRGKQSSTGKVYLAQPTGEAPATPSTRETTKRKKQGSNSEQGPNSTPGPR